MEYRIIRITEDGSPTRYRVQYKRLWFWRYLRKIVAVGPELPVSCIVNFESVEKAREFIRKQGIVPDARWTVNFEVVESHLTHG